MKKKIFSDVVLNMIASVIPVFTLQFILMPMMASKIDANTYGQVITIIALMNLSAATLGNVLNNSRLINYQEYEELKIQGDYNILLLLFVIINVTIMSIGLWYYQQVFELWSFILLMSSSIFMLIKGYATVEFRIKLKFKYILIDSIMLIIGYVIGFGLFLISEYWHFIYFCGFAFSFIFVINKTSIMSNPFKKTSLFKKTTIQTIVLLISGILLALGTYIDRLLLYPLLGGAAVSVYYTATILGKTISLVVQPITGVLLSYLAQFKEFDSKYFYLMLGVSSIIGAIGYVFIIIISEPLLTIVYPQYVEQAVNYIYITTLSIIVIIISNILNAVVLKFCNVRMQIVINGSYLLVYVFGSLVLLEIYGLMGFCIGILIASIVKLTVMIVVYYLSNKNIVV